MVMTIPSVSAESVLISTTTDYMMDGTLFGMMDSTCKSNFEISGLSLYRNQRWHQSQVENSNFYFGPLSLLLYGAASFLYEYVGHCDSLQAFADRSSCITGSCQMATMVTSQTLPRYLRFSEPSRTPMAHGALLPSAFQTTGLTACLPVSLSTGISS